MRVFERMRALRAFENQHLLFLGTDGHQHLIGEIGHHQAQGIPLTLKQLFLLDIGSIATVQRHLRRLKELGLVQHRRAARDRRSVEITLTPKCVRIFANYDTLMTVNSPAAASGKPRHVCGFCNGESSGRTLLATFLAGGRKRGDRCVLIAPAETQERILAEFRLRGKAPGGLVVTEGYESIQAQQAFFKREFRIAQQAGQALCLAADMTWTFSKNMTIEAIVEIEKRFDAMALRLPMTGLCVYDARRFSSDDFLRAAKCHRDHARHPILLG